VSCRMHRKRLAWGPLGGTVEDPVKREAEEDWGGRRKGEGIAFSKDGHYGSTS
jgi:hypothetical protein